MNLVTSIGELRRYVAIAGACTEETRELTHGQSGGVITMDLGPAGLLRVIGHGHNAAILTTCDSRLAESVPGQATVSALPLRRTLRTFDMSTVVTVETTASARLLIGVQGEELKEHWMPLERPVPEPHIVAVATDPLTLPRLDLLDAARVADAVGQEQYRPEYMYWLLRLGGDGLRSIGGDGGYFIGREGGCAAE